MPNKKFTLNDEQVSIIENFRGERLKNNRPRLSEREQMILKESTPSKKRLFYDIETSFCQGHFWRSGYNQTIQPSQIMKYGQIICISWKWEGEDEIHNADWGLKKQCDRRLLEVFMPELDRADEIVAHNGDRFDIKWVRTRAAYHGIEASPKYQSIDTLKDCRKYFNLPSNKLAEVARYFGLEAKLDSGGMDTWLRIIFDKDQEALDTMIHYCNGDIITLEAVFNYIRKYTAPKFNYAVANGGDRHSCPECGGNDVSLYKTRTTLAGTVRRQMKCGDCKTHFTISNKSYSDFLNKENQ